MISASGAWLAAVPSSGIPALCHRSMVAIHTTAKYWSVLPHQTPAPQGPVAMRPLRIHHLGSLWSSWNTIFLNDKSINDGHQSRSKPNAHHEYFHRILMNVARNEFGSWLFWTAGGNQKTKPLTHQLCNGWPRLKDIRFTLSAATWWVPPHLPFYFRIFHCNPSSYWESPLWKPPQSQTPTARG